MPTGKLMLVESCLGLDFTNIKSVVIGLLRQHINTYCGGDVSALFACFEDTPLDGIVSLVILENPTFDQVETIEFMIESANVDGPIFIKDCDNYFVSNVSKQNGVATMKITDKNEADISDVASKSYVQMTEKPQFFNSEKSDQIINIKEKTIISDTICVGGYSFENSNDFLLASKLCKVYQKGKAIKISRSISDCIWQLILKSHLFYSVPATQYIDWGTHARFRAYQETFATIFIDIDGTLVKNSGQYFVPRWGTTPGLDENVKFMKQLYDSNRCHIILTTARNQSFSTQTVSQMKRLGIKYHQIIYDLPHARRFVVNDYAPTNPYPAAVAVNIHRNAENLKDMFSTFLR